MIALFPLKTGDLMFVGFDSQNTSHSFPHYPNWNLWVCGIPIIGFFGATALQKSSSIYFVHDLKAGFTEGVLHKIFTDPIGVRRLTFGS